MWTNKAKHSNDSDCDDNYSLKDCESPAVTGESCSSHGGGMTRKRRRGVIEKRRRDRINNSLLELRRLVPAAYEKQGSAKLEKAEILQLTVDHLKTLHAKGLDALAYDPHKFAMDYTSIGFRECAAEVARYLVSVEGMDIQDPLRLRLMSHLQCFAAQRDLANKQAATANTWSIPPHPVGGSSYPGSSAIHQVAPMPVPPAATHILPPAAGHQHLPAQPGVLDQAHFNYGMMPENPSFHPNTARLVTTTSPGHQQNHPAAIISQPTTTMNSAQLQNTSPQYANIPTAHFPTLSAQNAAYSSATNGQGRPYRPWGAELAY